MLVAFKQIQLNYRQMQTEQPYPIRVFLEKLRFFTIFNAAFIIWIAAELLFYIIVTSQITCSQMSSLFISWTCSYAFELLVPIGSLLVVRYSKFYRAAYGYIVVMCAYKTGVVITVLAVAWKHVGRCYIAYDMRVIIIITNVLEFFCLVVELLLLWRARKVNREILLNNLVQKKIFAES